MTYVRLWALTAVAAVLVTAGALHAQASPAAASDELLASKGLTKAGTTYVLEADAKLPEALRVIRAAKKKLEDNGRKRAAVQAQIKDAQNRLARLDRQFGDLNARYNAVNSTDEKNELAAAINALTSQMREGLRYIEGKEKELKAVIDPKDDYVAAVLDLAPKMEAAAKRYAELAADESVTAAVAKINETARPKVRLGPTDQFAKELKPLLKMRESIESSAITLHTTNGVPTVDVTLNGKVTEPMILDSGASLIALTPATAAKLGLKPGPDDRVLKLSLADGRVVEGRLMKLDSVRVGHFTVEDVECTILPADVKEADNLLGGSFLSNFVYRMDMTAGVLYMSALGGGPGKVTADAGAAAKPGASAAPSAATPTTGPSELTAGGGGGGGGGAEIDLLARVDVEQDVVAGQWKKTAAGLECGESAAARVRLPIKPPKEYDFVMEFTRQTGNEGVAQHVSAGGRTFMFVIAGVGGGAHGLELIDGKSFDNAGNPTAVRPGKIRNGRRVKSVIQVRERSITVLLNDKPIITYAGSPATMSLRDEWKIGPGALGVGAWHSGTVFHTLKVIDKTAAGESASPANANATTKPAG
jgi:aspartyl protease family protein